MMHDHEHLNHITPYQLFLLKYPYLFYLASMQFMDLIMLSDFMQVLNNIRKHYTNNEYFYRHIPFIMIYLLQEHKLNPRDYSKQEIIMSHFVQAKEYGMIMYENYQCLHMHLFL
jgi:hypothetical protein